MFIYLFHYPLLITCMASHANNPQGDPAQQDRGYPCMPRWRSHSTVPRLLPCLGPKLSTACSWQTPAAMFACSACKTPRGVAARSAWWTCGKGRSLPRRRRRLLLDLTHGRPLHRCVWAPPAQWRYGGPPPAATAHMRYPHSSPVCALEFRNKHATDQLDKKKR